MSIPYRTTVAVRRVLTRHPWFYWVIVVGLAALLASATQSNLRSVRHARDDWGITESVWVATADVAPGVQLTGHVTRRDVPRAMMPTSAIIDGEIGGVARQHIAEGEIVTAVDVTATNGPLALVPSGWLVVVVSKSPGASIGSSVHVAADGVVLTRQALVVGEVDGALLVAVPEEIAPLLPAAAKSGSLALLLAP